jgi:signal transduction histidine kinase
VHRRTTQRNLLIVVVAVSVGLTGLTVWAVAQQGRALHDRELAAVRAAARTAAAEREGQFRADAEHAVERARSAWRVGGLDALDDWAVVQPRWLLVSMQEGDGTVTQCPVPLLARALPAALQPADVAVTESPDVVGTLRQLQQLAASPDPTQRGRALMAMADYERHLGHPIAAARIYADAAQSLRELPRLERFALRAEWARVAALETGGDTAQAHAALTALLADLIDAHPALVGTSEIQRLDELAQAVGLADETPGAANLATLRRRTTRRDAAAALLPALPPAGVPGREMSFETRRLPSGEPIVLVSQTGVGGVHTTLITPVDALLERYWPNARRDPRWTLAPADQAARARPQLVALGPQFGDAVLALSPETAARLSALASRQLLYVLMTAAGTIGAWVLVVWMLLRAMAQQRELARIQGRFVADVSHELKTPLALIRLLAETLADGRLRDPQRMQSYHETITREAERLTVLLDNILDLGRIESGRKQYEFDTCDVAAVVRQAWTLFEPQLAQDGFETRLEIEEGLPAIRADALALQQVLVNLLQNAHRYSSGEKFIRLAVRREGYVIVIVVEDHGIGMTRGQLNRLGESFFRAEDTRVRQTRGTGLGLAIANHIVTAHHGKVEVASRPGKGSTFTVWIPFEPDGTGE